MAKKNKPSKALQDEWDKKLKDSGFEDIETKKGMLKSWSSDIVQKRRANRNNATHYQKGSKNTVIIQDPNKVTATAIEAQQTYYLYAGYFLNDYTFDSEFDKTIWTYHSEGISYREIVKLLKGVKIEMNKDSVNKIVERYRKSMFELYFVVPRREGYHE